MLKITRIAVKSYQNLKYCNYYFWNRYTDLSNSVCKPKVNKLKNTLFYTCSTCLSYSNVGSKMFFHTTNRRDALPPIILILLRPLIKFIAIIFGRSIRVWWKALPEIKRKSFINSVKQRKYLLLACLSPIPVGSLYFYITHIDENPITKRKRFIVFSPQQMLQLADIEEKVLFEMHHNAILPPNNPSYGRVCRIVRNLIHSNRDIDGIDSYNWRVVVIDSPENVNAFVLPNGTLFMCTGMLEVCSNDDELGIVIAHEISHTILHHAAEQVSNAQLIECLLFLPVVVIWALLPDVGAVLMQYISSLVTKTLLHLPFSRLIEIEADDVGLRLAAKACFDVREAPCFWKKMKAQTLRKGQEETEWLSTHPSYDTRQTLLDELIPAALTIRDGCQCPKLSSRDPRLFIDSLLQSTKEKSSVSQIPVNIVKKQ